VTVSTLFPVRPDLANGLLAPDPSLAGTLDSVGAAGLPLNKCLQTGLRVQFIDQRPGYPPFTTRLNLVTNLTSNNANWSSGSSPGPKGLSDAMDWLENNAFIPRTIVIPVPKDSGGTIRIQGSFVQPIERDPVTGECKRFDPNLAPYQTYTIYGDAPLKIGGPPTVKLLVNFYGAQVVDANNFYAFGTYSIPSLVGNQINHPSGNDANRILCRDLTKKESCMNRGLIEFKIKATFFSS
jgi:hypothetical protein